MPRMGNTGEAMRRCRLIILALLLAVGAAGQAAVSVEVDRAPVIADQAFRLIFESDEKIDAEPDFSPLNESFTLLGNNRQTSVNILNGRLSRAQKWVLTLITDQTGTLTIPPIAFGSAKSEARRIEVVAEARPAGKGGDIFIEVEVDEPNPYVQAQVVYTLKLLRAAQVSNASLTEPAVADGRALINKLGEDKNYEIRRNNRRYRVTERRYAVFPQASGPLQIEPVLFKGQSGGLFSLDPFAPRPEPIVIRSAPVALAVRPIPAAFSGDRWLPAARLNIQEQWSTDPALLKQGEAATRALTLEAGGLAASQLPAPADALPDSFKTYPDQPEFEEANDRRGLVGTRREKMAVIPLEAGEFILPAIRIPWWNTGTDRPEVAELTARRVKVQAAPAPAPARSRDKPAPARQAEAAPGAAGSGAGAGAHWPLISALLLILWLGTLGLWWRGRRAASGAMARKPPKPPGPASIKRACMKNDAPGARDALLFWAGAKWPDKTIKNLAALGACGDAEFQHAISALNRHLYGKASTQWDGPTFYRVFAAQSFAETAPVAAPAGLEPLWRL